MPFFPNLHWIFRGVEEKIIPKQIQNQRPQLEETQKQIFNELISDALFGIEFQFDK